jgi:hypothetical protein
MSYKQASAKGLSPKAKELIEQLYNSSSSEDYKLAELLDDIATGNGVNTEQARDEFLIVVCEEMTDTCSWFIQELKK